MNYLLLLYILPTLIHAQDPQYLTNYGYPLCAVC
jgi:hypothetical protein